MYNLQVNIPNEIKQIADAIYPFSITKLKQIDLFLEFFSLKESLPKARHNPSVYRDAYLEMIDIYIELRKLNERGTPPDYEDVRKRLKNNAQKEIQKIKMT